MKPCERRRRGLRCRGLTVPAVRLDSGSPGHFARIVRPFALMRDREPGPGTCQPGRTDPGSSSGNLLSPLRWDPVAWRSHIEEASVATARAETRALAGGGS